MSTMAEAAQSADYERVAQELARASSALSRANQAGSEMPFRNLLGALLDAVVALEEMVEEISGESDG